MTQSSTVHTTDPRGINRSPLDDPGQDSTPALRAADLSRPLARLDAGSAAIPGSSGGAVTALALAQTHPDRCRSGRHSGKSSARASATR